MITVVSGLPRSGTSLMMQILKENGFDILTDNLRQADVNNPNGYYEYEKVKSLASDNSWLNEAEGKVIKVIVQLLPFLNNKFDYKIIYMERNIEEIILSQSKMLNRLDKQNSSISNEALGKIFLEQSKKSIDNIKQKNSYELVVVNFSNLFVNPVNEIEKIKNTLQLNLDPQKSSRLIDQELYHNKINMKK